MSNCDFENEFAQTIWQEVQEHYETGYMSSEATLQACLFAELRSGIPFCREHKFPRHHVVAGPTWYPGADNDPKQYPDLVIANEASVITDILELKFVPQGYVEWKDHKDGEGDIDKLIRYVENKKLRCHVEIDPESGRYTDKPHEIGAGCGLHFVVVAQPDAEALCTETIRNYIKGRIPEYSFYHWKGPTGPIAGRQWTIKKVQ